MSAHIGNINAPALHLKSLSDVKLYIKQGNKYINLNSSNIEDSHIHNLYEMYVSISGNVSFLHNSNVYTIDEGDIIFSAPGDIHHCIYHSSIIHRHYCLWFSVSDDSCVAEYIKEKNLCGFIRLSDSGKDIVFSLLERLNSSHNISEFEKSLCFFRLFETLFSHRVISANNNKPLPKQLCEILKYIEKNFSAIRTVEEVANRFYVSVTSLNRNFREYIKLSPHKFLTAKRLSYAEKLLSDGCSVTDACFLSGFRDCSRFIEQFKKHYGVTPNKYKKDKF